MLDGYGLHSLVWNLACQVVFEIFIASLMDASGRGIALKARENGVACNLSVTTAYLNGTQTQQAAGLPGEGTFVISKIVAPVVKWCIANFRR